MSAIELEYEDVVSDYCQSFRQELAALISLANEASDTPDERRWVTNQLYQETHRMAGAAHCMGFRSIGKDLDAIEKDLESIVGSETHEFDPTSLVPVFRSLEGHMSLLSPKRSKLLKMTDEIDFSSAEEGFRSNTTLDAKTRMISRETVLFADDDPHIRDLMQIALNKLGAGKIVLAESGEDVLAKIETEAPTFIISDWQMAPMNGLELLEAIRSGQTSIARDTPVVFLTSMSKRANAIIARRHGVNALISKPAHPRAIANQMMAIIEKRFQLKSFMT